MHLDHDLIRKILIGFEKVPSLFTTLDDVAKTENIKMDDLFFHNCYLIADQNLIVNQAGNSDIGLEWGLRREDGFTQSVIPLRLTAEGHEYLSAIKEPARWKKIKKIAGSAGLQVIIAVAKSILGKELGCN
jgi:hypothetical protein